MVINKWWFPEKGVPPVIIHLQIRFSLINSPNDWGTPMVWKPPNDPKQKCQYHPLRAKNNQNAGHGWGFFGPNMNFLVKFGTTSP